MRCKTTRVAPYSRPPALGRLDRRTREGKLLTKARTDLVAHVGGKPSATQTALIERVAFLMLRVTLLDEKHTDGGWTEHDTRTYLAWVAALNRALRQLGLKGAAERPPSLRDHLAQRAAA